jgi:hypothetical protein
VEVRATREDVLGLRPGDLVRHDGAEYVVERSLHFSERGCSWAEHRLSDNASGRSVTLEVLEQDELVLTLFERLPDAGPPPDEDAVVQWEGLEFAFAERGLAEYRSQERAGAPKRGTMAYVEYAGGEARLAFSCFDESEWELARGRRIHLADVGVPSG